MKTIPFTKSHTWKDFYLICLFYISDEGHPAKSPAFITPTTPMTPASPPSLTPTTGTVSFNSITVSSTQSTTQHLIVQTSKITLILISTTESLMNDSQFKSNDINVKTGYMITIGILGGLLGLAIVYIAFLLYKKRCSSFIVENDGDFDEDSELTHFEMRQIDRPLSVLSNNTYLEPASRVSSENVYADIN